MKTFEPIFKLKNQFMRDFLTVNLTAARKFILELNSCFGDHMLMSVSCTNRETSIKQITWKETTIET